VPIASPDSARRVGNAVAGRTPETAVADAIGSIAMLKSKALLSGAKAL